MLRLTGIVVVLFAVAASGPIAGSVGAQEPGLGAAAAAETVGPEGGESSPEWEAAKVAVLSELEGLRGDIHMLTVLRLLQTRLFEWNEALLESGAGLQFLDADLCDEAEVSVWCELLPVSFGLVGEDG